MRLLRISSAALIGLISASLIGAASAQPMTMPTILPTPPVADDGAITTPSFSLPYSSFASSEARAEFVDRLRNPMPIVPDLRIMRERTNEMTMPKIEAAARLYPYTSTRSTIGNVPVETFVPTAGIAAENRNRVLINLHGGGFVAGGGGPGGAIESIPIAGEARIRVVAVDYRLTPEHTIPDAVEDVKIVYRELLRTYRPENIGIFGCSAGGSLTSLATAAFIRENLPLPGAIGVFCSSLRGFQGGDSAQLWPRMGSVIRMEPATPQQMAARPADPLSINTDDMRRFPPTLFLTGTRAPEMSGAAQSHLELRSLGVTSDLLLFDGLDHGFFSDPNLPESKRAYELIARFFSDHLGVRRSSRSR